MDDSDRPAAPGDNVTVGQTPRDVPRDLVRTWSVASERAFATAAADPHSYVRTARLVAAVTDALRKLGHGTAPLLTAWQQRQSLVFQVAEFHDLLTTAGLDLEAVAGAAFAMRYREISAEVVHEERLSALTALPAESTWAVLEESGYSPGDPFVPYRRLEVDPSTGRALVITTRPDESYLSCIHAVELVRIDRSTGELLPPADNDRPAEPEEFTNAREREAAVTAIKETGST